MAAEPWGFQSSNLDAGSYDPETGEMTITFKSGSTYSYSGVPQSVWDGLKNAPSAGKYFNSEIKGRFE